MIKKEREKIFYDRCFSACLELTYFPKLREIKKQAYLFQDDSMQSP